MKAKLWVICITLLFAGCANISTLDRTTTLPPRSWGVADGTGPGINKPGAGSKSSGLLVHLDAPQRVVVSRPGFVCAEPSPDALQAYASSFGFGLSIPTTASASVAQALATSAASIGLRTQSITLMRDHLYRICEASYNEQITELDVAQLLRRSQDMTLGILAIEQISGAVVARQAALDSSANAKASANLADTEALLDRATKKERSKKEDWDKAVEKRKNQEKVQKKSEEVSNASPDDEALLTDKNTQTTQLEEDKQKEKDAEEAYQRAQEVRKDIESNFDTATTSAKAMARGKGEFSNEVAIGGKIDKETVQEVSKAAHDIVFDIINKGHLTDSCISVMNRFAMLEKTEEDDKQKKAEKDLKKKALEPLHNSCVQVFEANVQLYLQKLKNLYREGNEGSPPVRADKSNEQQTSPATSAHSHESNDPPFSLSPKRERKKKE